jgi:uncharacterized short protein YbdD (DUF466 family)
MDGRTDVTPSTARGPKWLIGSVPSGASHPQGDNWWANLLTILRRVAGMPDYAAHVEHLRRCHPDVAIPSERQFYDDFVRARYGDGPTRCC